MKVAISDANILIDLFHIDLLESFIKLDIKINTTDFVVAEVYKRPEQKSKIEPLIKNGSLKVNTFSAAELMNIVQRNENHKGISLEDSSVWYWAEQNEAIVLTGDKKLRKAVASTGLEVHGSLWVLDELVTHQILTKKKACKAIKNLIASNDRLPKKECAKRVAKWCS